MPYAGLLDIKSFFFIICPLEKSLVNTMLLLAFFLANISDFIYFFLLRPKTLINPLIFLLKKTKSFLSKEW